MNEAVRDRFGRGLETLRVSVTDRCNFRCPYCMPAEVFGEGYAFLPRADLLTFEEIERLVRAFVRAGVRKIRLTGGEPLLRSSLEKLVAGLAAIPGLEDLALTTNGFLLADRVEALKAAGLRRVTVSLDSDDPDVFRAMNGDRAPLEAVLRGIEAARSAGLAPIKVNAVVVRGMNEGSIVPLARRFRGTGMVMRFIEFMDVGTANRWAREKVVPASEIERAIHTVFPIEAVPRTNADEPAERFRYLDGAGEVGIVASVTRPFCGACTRARLTTDGRLVTCLFASTGPDLRSVLRGGATDAELDARIAAIWSARDDRYSELRAADQTPRPKAEMFQLGG